MRIKNISTGNVIISDLPGKQGGQGLQLSPGQEELIYNELAERSVQLLSFIDAGIIQKLSTEEPLDKTSVADTPTEDNHTAILANDKIVQFVNDADNIFTGSPPFAYSGTSPKQVRIVVTDGDGTRDYANSVSTVQISTSSGTIDGSASPVTKKFDRGLMAISVAGSGTVTISFSNITHPLSSEVPPVTVTSAGNAEITFA